MTTMILDVDLDHVPEWPDGLRDYDHALILIRVGGVPVGQALLPIADGLPAEGDLLDTLIAAVNWNDCRPLLRSRLLGAQPHPVGHGSWPGRVGGPRVTIAVCTRDRPRDLERCLQGISRLPWKERGDELLVVDNCPSTDATHGLVHACSGARYVREPRPGLNVARNRAMQAASGEIVAFLDDDTIPDPGWLDAMLPDFRDLRVMAVTGLTMPLELETEAQEWFERYSRFGRGFCRIEHDRSTLRPCEAGRTGAGANMALRRCVIDLVGPFDEALDAGTPTRSGGDTEMLSRILDAGRAIVYEPAALCWHRHRREWGELRDTIYGYGAGTYAFWTRRLLTEHDGGVVPRALSWLLRYQMPALARSLLRRPGAVPADLLVAELRGCLTGPRAYLSARRERAEDLVTTTD